MSVVLESVDSFSFKSIVLEGHKNDRHQKVEVMWCLPDGFCLGGRVTFIKYECCFGDHVTYHNHNGYTRARHSYYEDGYDSTLAEGTISELDAEAEMRIQVDWIRAACENSRKSGESKIYAGARYKGVWQGDAILMGLARIWDLSGLKKNNNIDISADDSIANVARGFQLYESCIKKLVDKMKAMELRVFTIEDVDDDAKTISLSALDGTTINISGRFASGIDGASKEEVENLRSAICKELQIQGAAHVAILDKVGELLIGS